MKKNSPKKSLLDAYQFIGFKTSAAAKGKLGDKNARVLSLTQRSKKVSALNVVNFTKATMTARSRLFEIYRVVIVGSISNLKFVESFAKGLV